MGRELRFTRRLFNTPTEVQVSVDVDTGRLVISFSPHLTVSYLKKTYDLTGFGKIGCSLYSLEGEKIVTSKKYQHVLLVDAMDFFDEVYLYCDMCKARSRDKCSCMLRKEPISFDAFVGALERRLDIEGRLEAIAFGDKYHEPSSRITTRDRMSEKTKRYAERYGGLSR